MKLGIYGGSYDPPHNGHIIVAEYVRKELGLDRVILVPSYVPPHKQERQLSAPGHRLAMTRLAVEGCDGLDVSDIELEREGVSYTIDTLNLVKQQNPSAELFLLLGMDNYVEFNLWKNTEGIRRISRLVVMTRPGTEQSTSHGGDTIVCSVPAIDISSTQIREKVKRGESIQYLVPEPVRLYIAANRLYC